jgi:hypothetical protein
MPLLASHTSRSITSCKVKRPFVWHKHEDTDAFFLVVQRRLTIQLGERNIARSLGSSSSCRRRRALPDRR